MKTVLSLFICLTLLFTGTAGAAMTWCMADVEQTAPAVHMDNGDTAMPCHDAADSESKDSNNGCNDCDCQHCAKMTALPPKTSAQYSDLASSIRTITVQSVVSCQPEGVFQPPKQIS